jgi:membrane carboxypeptidase/penicillin-binding protein PbpC
VDGLDDTAIAARPDGMREQQVCSLSGMRANAWCPSARREWMPASGSGGLPCSWHHESDGDVVVIWPAEYRQWAAQEGRLADRRIAPPQAPSLAAAAPRAQAPPSAAPLAIANPPSGSTFLIDPTLRREFQALPLRVTVDRPGPIVWRVDGTSIGTSSSESPIMWPLRTGTHRITAEDVRGRTAEATIIVR